MDEDRRGRAKLDEYKVRAIKTKLNQGWPAKELAKTYGVGTETILRIGRGVSWSWVQAEARPELIERLAQESAAMMPERLKAMGEQAAIEQEKYAREAPSDAVRKLAEHFTGGKSPVEEAEKRRKNMMEAAKRLEGQSKLVVGKGDDGETEIPIRIEGHVDLDQLGGNPMDLQVNPGEVKDA